MLLLFVVGWISLVEVFQQFPKSILMSWWKVDDTATQELMTLFYEKLDFGKNKDGCFKEAQLSLKKKYSSPYYWGAFVMMGN